MNSLKTYLKAFFVVLTTSISGLAAAAGLYNSGANLSFTPGALSENGSVVGSAGGTNSTSSSQVTNYFMTGASATNPQQISTMTTSVYSGGSNVSSASGAYAFDSSLWTYPRSQYYNPNGPLVETHTAGYVGTCSSTPGCVMTSPVMSFVGVNDNGVVAGNANFAGSDVPLEGTWGSVYNRQSGTQTLIGGTVTGLSSTNYVAFDTTPENVYNSSTGTTTLVSSTINILDPNSAVTTVTGTGLGGFSGGVNATGQVTGGMYTSLSSNDPYNYPNSNVSVAFKTGANGSGTQLFGTANGVASAGTVINASGQVGGYVTLSSGQTEAFLSTARGGLMVGLGAGTSTDSTRVVFLNDSGQAIVQDTTTGVYYLYSGGVIVPVSSLTGASANDPVVGFNNAGDILLQDPALYSLTSGSTLSASSLSTLSGAVSISGTSAFQAMSAAQGGATPTSTFYSDPSASTSSISLTTVGSAGVPGPATAGLLLLAIMGALSLRKRDRAFAS